jgi:tRNA A-37 threonylcarbamoyl transferase component Bud32
MARVLRCPQCQEELAADAPEGLCPECLLQQGLAANLHGFYRQAQGRSSPQISPFLPPEPAELAEDFPQLEILELLGQGGMGAVYKARQKKLDRLVALKILPLETGRDPAFAERFAREARALARLNHPNVVGVHDFGEVEGLYYFVMEYVDGVNLRQLLETGRLTPEEALKIIPQLCDALQYAHEEEIVHRDIKPENILLTKRGRVKIADFGLAKLLGPMPFPFSLTGSQQVMGTPYYMAPEQMHKSRTVDHRADIYSLGVVFYEMLTGELPLGRFGPPSQKVALDRRLDEVVFRALEKEPEQRYQHISDVKNAVENIVAGQAARPVQATPAAGPRGWQAEGPRLHVLLPDWSGVKHGLLRLEGDALHLEWDAGVVAGWIAQRYREVKIPLAELESVRFEKKWGGRLRIRARRLMTLADVPGCVSGEARWHVLWSDRAAAEQLAEQVARRLGTATPVAPTPWDEAVLRWSQRLRSINLPAGGLILTGVVAFFFWFGMLVSKGAPNGSFGEQLGIWCMILAAFSASFALMVGGICMRMGRARPFCLAMCVLAMLPWSAGFFIGLPVGLWALLTLVRPNWFARVIPKPAAERNAQPPPAAMPHLVTGPILRGVRSFAGSIRSLFLGSRVKNPAAQVHGPVPTHDYKPRPQSEPPAS